MNSTYLIICLIVISFFTNLLYSNNNTNVINVEYEIYENILVWGCDYYNGEKGLKINILNVTGGSGVYNVTFNGNGAVEPNNLRAGEGFVYFFTESDFQFGSIGFTITDTQQNSIAMEANLISILESLFLFANCNAPIKCAQSTITHTQQNSNIVISDVYQASNKITSTADMPDGNVSYLANNEIHLDEGFHVKILTNFTADIVKPCSIVLQ